MNFNVLRYVEAIAEEESFTKAAERLYVAQPSLSQAIRTLEQDLGAALFVRNGRSTTLTRAGSCPGKPSKVCRRCLSLPQ